MASDRSGTGSSPLARGTPSGDPPRPDGRRFIPARAGNTRNPASFQVTSSVHPRSRGEHERAAGIEVTAAGSSPLARGTPPPVAAHVAVPRFIPARAGNTGGLADVARLRAVHPRSRGEHFLDQINAHKAIGSSPLARGTLAGEADDRRLDRFIPARAGNTGTCRRPNVPISVHPRSRGEHRAP